MFSWPSLTLFPHCSEFTTSYETFYPATVHAFVRWTVISKEGRKISLSSNKWTGYRPFISELQVTEYLLSSGLLVLQAYTLRFQLFWVMGVFTNNNFPYSKKSFPSIVDSIVLVRLPIQDNRVNMKYMLE